MQLNLADRFVPAEPSIPRCGEGFFPSADRTCEESRGAQLASLVAEIRELKAQLDQVHAERAKWMESQRRMMDLLHTAAPEKLVHDLRNVLNERDLLKALVDQM